MIVLDQWYKFKTLLDIPELDYNGNYTGRTYNIVKEGDNKMNINNTRVSNEFDTPERSLINNYFNKEKNRIDNDKKIKKQKVYNNLKIYQLAKAYVDEYNKTYCNIEQANKNGINLEHILMDPIDMVSAISIKEINDIEKEYDLEINKLSNKCDELFNLLSITDTYQEKYNLLTKYKIIQ